MGKRKTEAAGSTKVGKIAEMANAYRQRRAKAQAKATAQGEAEVRRVEGLSVLNAHAAGSTSGRVRTGFAWGSARTRTPT